MENNDSIKQIIHCKYAMILNSWCLHQMLPGCKLIMIIFSDFARFTRKLEAVINVYLDFICGSC